ncbi:sulfotransferase [Pseudooceanicola sp. C21-150M6]|uniref:sulfotransferase n=1 Tax=Pseudooceanicola sp. C21-150M6 TaxID=3434355 RepID=UPI003D7FFC50
MRLRVVNLGLPKSGTTTLGRALRRAGLHVADHRVHAGETKRPELEEAFVADLLYKGYFASGDPLAELQEFDGFSEISALRVNNPAWPQFDFGLIEALRQVHPDIRFVATWREAEEISTSMLNWTNMVERMVKAPLPGLPLGYGAEDAERVRWIVGHYSSLTRYFAEDPHFLLLDMAAEDAADQLASFIGRPVPWWGVANRNLAAAKAGEA